jgi:hypothetical protein
MLSRSSSHYLIPPPGYHWKWDPQEHVATWADGSTLAFARELTPVLWHLAEQVGLPPLGAVLLVMHVAKRPTDWRTAWEACLKPYAMTFGFEGKTLPHTLSRLMMPVEQKLAMLADLPDYVKKGQSEQLNLLRTLFQTTFNRLPVDRSMEIVEEFRRAAPGQLLGEHDMSGLTRLLRDMKALESALSPWDLPGLIDALSAGLANVSIESAELEEIPKPDAEGDLLSDLEHSRDDELTAVASVARQLMAVMQLPRPLLQADDQPVGGVSDITNKGDPSQLLVSELAWDDLTLAVRLAHQEALYLRRETPPASPLPQRFVLLDNGILLWGRARVYAAGAALALLRPRSAEEEITLMLHQGGLYTTCELKTRIDLLSLWSQQEPAADCAAALAIALDILLAEKPEEQPEIILITQRDALEALTPLLSHYAWPAGARFFSLAVDAQSHCVLHQRSALGSREVQSLKLSPPAALKS